MNVNMSREQAELACNLIRFEIHNLTIEAGCLDRANLRAAQNATLDKARLLDDLLHQLDNPTETR